MIVRDDLEYRFTPYKSSKCQANTGRKSSRSRKIPDSIYSNRAVKALTLVKRLCLRHVLVKVPMSRPTPPQTGLKEARKASRPFPIGLSLMTLNRGWSAMSAKLRNRVLAMTSIHLE